MENINLEKYKVFYFTANNKSITKTSKELMISQPAITQTIKKLESEIGYQLFFRTKNGLELTNEGEYLYHHVKDAIECLNESKKTLDYLKGKKERVIRIGGGTTLLKHNALAGFKKFREKYSDIKIEIKKDITKNLFYELIEGKLDLVFFNMPITDVNIEALEIIPVETIHDIFVADTKNFSYLKDKIISAKELESLPFVLQSELSTSRKYLDQFCTKNNIKLKDSYDLSSYDLVIEFVKAGLGIGFINKNHIIKDLESGKIFEIKTDFVIPDRKVGIAINKKCINHKYLKEFIQVMKEIKKVF